MILIALSNIAICGAQIYLLCMLSFALNKKRGMSFGSTPRKARLAIYSMVVVSLLEFATTIYDIDGPGKHFPLEVRLPVLVAQSILMLRAL